MITGKRQQQWLTNITISFITVIKSELIDQVYLVLVSFESVDWKHPEALISFIVSLLVRNIRYTVAELIIFIRDTKIQLIKKGIEQLPSCY